MGRKRSSARSWKADIHADIRQADAPTVREGWNAALRTGGTKFELDSLR